MMQVHDESAPGERRLLRWAVGLFIGVLVLLAAYATYRVALGAAVEAELAQIRERGEAVTPEDVMELLPDPAAGANAATHYLEAIGRYREEADVVERIPMFSGDPDVEDPARDEPYSDEMMEAMGRFVEMNEPMFEGLRAAAEYEEARYVSDFSDGHRTLLPHLSELRKGAEALAVAIRWHVENDRLEAAVDELMVAIALAESLRDEPMIISQLVRGSIHGLIQGELERMLARRALSTGQLGRIDEALHATEGGEPLTNTMIVERAIVHDLFDRPVSVVADWLDESEQRIVFRRVSGIADFDRLRYLGLMEEVVESTRAQGWEALSRVAEVEQRAERMPIRYTVAREFTMAISGGLTGYLVNVARTRTARLALAIERYRLEHGGLPADLEALVPTYVSEVPLDPFDGDPMRYRRREVGYVVYSVGRGGVDQGGREGDGRPAERDVTFVVER